METVEKYVLNGRNVLLHGPGGTGKSYTLRTLAVKLQRLGKKVFVTALTGIAAVNLAGSGIKTRTLHSWAGVGLARESDEKLLSNIQMTSNYRKRWRSTDILIIDEVSMLGANLITKLDYIGRHIRGRPFVAFGGLQLVVSGDFMQLPPVEDKFCFATEVWTNLNFIFVPFVRPMRYDDLDYFQLLLRVRKGAQTFEDIEVLKSRIDAYDDMMDEVLYDELDSEHSNEDQRVKPTMIYSLKRDVSSYNMQKLQELTSAEHNYICEDSFRVIRRRVKKDYYMKSLDDAMPRSIVLKVGAQVMVKANLDVENGLVNGTRGVVVDCGVDFVNIKLVNGQTARIIKHTWIVEDDDMIASRKQIPLILAWASTIHKCVSGDTLVFTPFGIKRMDSLITLHGYNKKELEIFTGYGISKTTHTYKIMKEVSIVVRTRMGFELQGSFRHPVLVRTPDGKEIWKLLPDVELGDNIVMKYGMQAGPLDYLNVDEKHHNLPELINEKLSYVIGLMVGNGRCQNKKDGIVEFTNSNKDLLEIYDAFVLELFGKKCSWCNEKGLCFTSRSVVKFLEWCGLSYRKKIPVKIMESPISCQIAFLCGLFDTKEWVNNTVFTSFAEQLTKEVHIMLLNIGIISRRSIIDDTKWIIEISDPDIYSKLTKKNSLKDRINLITDVSGKKLKNLGNNTFFDEIIEINTGACEMYDFTIPETSCFITNGIMSHNCQGTTLDYAVCDLGDSIFADGQAYVALSRVKNLRGLFLCNFIESSIMTSAKALEFVSGMSTYIKKVSIFGTSRHMDNEISKTILMRMFDKARLIVTSNMCLVGYVGDKAAHIAIWMYILDLVSALILHLPCPWQKGKLKDDKINDQLGTDLLNDIAIAIEKGAAVQVHNSLAECIDVCVESELIIIFGWGDKPGRDASSIMNRSVNANYINILDC